MRIFCTFWLQLDPSRKSIFLSKGEIGWSTVLNSGRFELVSYSICQNPPLFGGQTEAKAGKNHETGREKKVDPADKNIENPGGAFFLLL